jgi:hypothetical protein
MHLFCFYMEYIDIEIDEYIFHSGQRPQQQNCIGFSIKELKHALLFCLLLVRSTCASPLELDRWWISRILLWWLPSRRLYTMFILSLAPYVVVLGPPCPKGEKRSCGSVVCALSCPLCGSPYCLYREASRLQ